jgi:hypothetical protein
LQQVGFAGNFQICNEVDSLRKEGLQMFIAFIIRKQSSPLL